MTMAGRSNTSETLTAQVVSLVLLELSYVDRLMVRHRGDWKTTPQRIFPRTVKRSGRHWSQRGAQARVTLIASTAQRASTTPLNLRVNRTGRV